MKVSRCRSANSCSSASRAIEPSGFRISQITPAGWRPASRARSTAASVCPTRCSTPPGRARSGGMCPGRRRSPGLVAEWMATWIVVARSLAEMPVVVPKRRSASIVTVNAVACSSVLLSTCWGSSSWLHRSGVSARQRRPRPCVVMKLMRSGVTSWAAQTRSPSFSRSSSSATTTSLPLRTSSMACSMVPKGIVIRGQGAGGSAARACTTAPCPLLPAHFSLLHECPDVLPDHISLHIHPVAGPERAERGVRQGERHQRYLNDTIPRTPVHREAHAVHRDRPEGNRRPAHLVRDPDVHQVLIGAGPDPLDLAHAVDMPLGEESAGPVAGAERALEIDPIAGPEPAQAGPLERGGYGVHAEPPPALRRHREAGTAHRDAFAQRDPAPRRADRELAPAAVFGDGDGAHLADGRHDAGEHGSRSRTSSVSSPRARRSTTLHRSASASPAWSQPDTAGGGAVE